MTRIRWLGFAAIHALGFYDIIARMGFWHCMLGRLVRDLWAGIFFDGWGESGKEKKRRGWGFRMSSDASAGN